MTKKIVPLVTSLIFLNFIFAHNVLAEEQFSTSYFVTYDFTKESGTAVDFQITVVNLTNKAYVKEYNLNIASINPKEIKALDKNGTIRTQVNKKDDLTQINTVFNDKVVGVGASRQWHILYTDEDVGKKNGLIWTIAIPRFSNVTPLNSYMIKLNIPDYFGPEIYSSPRPSRIEKNDNLRIYYFDDDNLRNTGALLNFGVYQLYSFNLKYHLKNPNLVTSKVKIALPPTIRSEQEIYINKISPPPINVEEDADGNYLALYQLTGPREVVVEVEGYARVTHPNRNLENSGFISEIPRTFTDKYLAEQPYWETKDPQIKEIVKELVKPEMSVSQAAKVLFDYTTANLKYNKGRINNDLTRFGAKKALLNKDNAVCMEFADLLTTLLRTAKIPAQLLEGYAFTEDEDTRPVVGDILHSWVRYYDPRIGWVSVDPTWSSTSKLDYFGRLDTNHLVFAIKGESSIRPYPAGAYKISPLSGGDIEVEISGKDISFPKENIEIGAIIKEGIIPYLTQPRLKLLILNKGGISVFDVRLKTILRDENITFNEIRPGNLPPYSQKEFDLKTGDNYPKISKSGLLKAEIEFTDFSGEFRTLSWNQSLNLDEKLPKTAIILSILLTISLWVYLLLEAPRRFRKR